MFLFDCVFASSLFSLHPPHYHATAHAHTHPPHTIQHDALVHTITCKQSHVLCCLFWEWTARHTASSTPHTPSLDITQHTNEPNTDTAHGASKDDMTIASEKGIGQREKVGQHSSTNTLIESPKPFHFLNALHSVHTWQDMPTPRNWLSWQEHIGFDTHKTVPHT